MATMETRTRLTLDIVPSGQLVTFTLDGVEFGLDNERVQEHFELVEQSFLTLEDESGTLILDPAELLALAVEEAL